MDLLVEKRSEISNYDRIDLGCGEDKKTEFGVDKVNTESCDWVVDLDSDEWNLPSNKFMYAWSDQVVEHLERPMHFFRELHRICKEGAEVEIRLPHASSQAWQTPEHNQFLNSEFPYIFLEPAGSRHYRFRECPFKVQDVRIEFSKRKMLPWNYIMEPIVNTSRFSQLLYERSGWSRLFPAHKLYMRLSVVSKSNDE